MRYLVACIALTVGAGAQEMTLKSIQAAFAEGLESFEQVGIEGGGKTSVLAVTLGARGVTIGGDEFDGFRFRCPEVPEGTDFVWYFNAPANWANWYIVPVEGEPGDAFRDWLYGDKLYVTFDKAGEEGRERVLQTLDGGYFKPGAEYVMWFRKRGPGDESDLRGVAGFAVREDGWKHDEIETALGLKAAPAEDQVAGLSSRGGLILLDGRFFERGYAEGRIDAVFFSIRQFRRMAGGFFVRVETTTPPCETNPSLAEIAEKHGPADFVRDAAELARVAKHAGGTRRDEVGARTVSHHYDHFAFEVEADAEDPKVQQVTTSGTDFSVLAPPGEGAGYAQIDTENLTVFHKDGKEVGRAYFFGEGAKEPLFITRPPEGAYPSGNEVLLAKGGGEWVWETRFPGGEVARRLPMSGDRLEGRAEGFHENGKLRFAAEYRAGKLDGEVVQFDETGAELSRERFKDGEPVGE